MVDHILCDFLEMNITYKLILTKTTICGFFFLSVSWLIVYI